MRITSYQNWCVCFARCERKLIRFLAPSLWPRHSKPNVPLVASRPYRYVKSLLTCRTWGYAIVKVQTYGRVRNFRTEIVVFRVRRGSGRRNAVGINHRLALIHVHPNVGRASATNQNRRITTNIQFSWSLLLCSLLLSCHCVSLLLCVMRCEI